MRSELTAHLHDEPELKLLDADLKHLFASWFNRGFLELRRIDWQSPAAVLEKLIAYEAVHEIEGWVRSRKLNVTYITLSLEVAMSNRPLALATCPVPPATDPIGPLTHRAQTELATAHDLAALPSPRRVRPSSAEAADEPGANPRPYRVLHCVPQDNATRILIEAERLLRLYGHCKITRA